MAKRKKTGGKRHPDPTPEELAKVAGEKYAYDQIAGEYFHNWILDQLIEASKMDPEHVLPLETKVDAQTVARKMLQQLEWDAKRDARNIDIPEGEEKAFWEGFHKACMDGAHSLADEILYLNREIKGGAREARPTTRVRDYIAVDSRGRKIAGPFKNYSDAKHAAGPGGHTQFIPSARARARA